MDTRLAKLKRSLESAIDGLSAEQLGWHPPGKWSAAEVLEHLYLSYTGTTRGLEKMIASGKPSSTRPSFRDRIRSFVVLDLGYLPSGRQAPIPTRPKGLPAEQVRREFVEKIAAMDAMLARAEAHFGSHARLLDHPFLGPFTASQWRKFHCIHGRHHEKQIRRLRTGAKNPD